MSLATLSIDIVAQLAKLQTGMDQAARIAEKNAAQIAAAFGKVNAVIVGLGGAAIGASLVGLAGDAMQGVLAIKDLAEASGASIENVSALEDIAKRAGGSLAEVSTTLVKFNQVLQTATSKNDAGKIFKALGLDLAELKRLDPAEALRQTAVALSGYAEDGEKARVIQALFGKSVQESAGFLRDLAEAGPLKPVVTAEQAEQVDQYAKNLAQLKTNFDDAARSILSAFVPAINEVVKNIRASGGIWKALLGGVDLDTLAFQRKELEGISAQIRGLTDQAAEFRQAMDKDAKAGLPENRAYRQRYDELRDRLFKLQEQAQRTRDGLLQTAEAMKPITATITQPPPASPTRRLKVNLDGDDPKNPKKAKVEVNPRDVPDPSVLAVIRAIESTDAAKIAQLNEQLRGLVALQRLEPEDAALAEAIAKTRDELDKLSPSAKKAAEEKRRLDEILGQTPSAAFDKVLADIDLVEKALAEGAIPTIEQYREALAVISGGTQKIAEVNDVAQSLGLTFTSAFEDAIVNGSKFSDVLKGIEQDLLRLAVRKSITEPFMNMVGTIDWGSIFGSAFGGQRAAGGPVQAGKFYRINELASHGPGEILNVGGEQYLMAASSGVVQPMQAGSSGGRGAVTSSSRALRITYAPQIHIDSRSDQAQVAALVRREVQAGNAQLVEQINRGVR